MVQHHPGMIISPLLLLGEDTEKERVVLDTEQANKRMSPPKFKLPTRDAPTGYIQEDDVLIKLDFKSAYHLVSLHKSMQKYFVFEHLGQYYQYQVLPQGWNYSPWIWTRFGNRVHHITTTHLGLRMTLYMDDALIALKPHQRQRTLQQLLPLWGQLGLILSDKKCMLEGHTSLEYLGYQFSTTRMTIRTTTKVQQSILRLLKEASRQSRHDRLKLITLQRVIGKILGYQQAYPAARIGLRPLMNFLAKFDQKWFSSRKNRAQWIMPNSLSLTDDIDQLRATVKKQPSRCFRPLQGGTLTTDSSGYAWGGIWNSKARYITTKQACWNNEELTWHINVKELVTLERIIIALDIRNRHILWRVDNVAAMAAMQHVGTSTSETLNKIALQIWRMLLQRNLQLLPVYVSSLENEADWYSRFQTWDNLQITQKCWTQVLQLYPTLRTDVFCNKQNQIRSLQCWNSHCALMINWNKAKGLYMFPPPTLLPAVAQKLRQEICYGILITPTWQTKQWWSSLLTTNWRPVLNLNDIRTLVTDDQGQAVNLSSGLTVWQHWNN
jgi:hypothetical protein